MSLHSYLQLLCTLLRPTVYRHKQWVSIKIAKADRLHQFRELQSLQSLAKASTSSLAFEHIVELRDDFVHKGPNGSHQCLVFELLGPTLETEIKREKSAEMRIDPDTVIRISIQILKALTFMHKAGYAHGGTDHLHSTYPVSIRLLHYLI